MAITSVAIAKQVWRTRDSLERDQIIPPSKGRSSTPRQTRHPLGDDTSRERLRRFLGQNVTGVDQAQDCFEAC